MLRTNTCGELSKKQVGDEVTLCGWVHRRRDHGGIIFIDLRDRYGLTQIKFDPDIDSEAHKKAEDLRSEWVIQATGKVAERPSDMINNKMETGEIEVEISKLEILNKSKMVHHDKLLCSVCVMLIIFLIFMPLSVFYFNLKRVLIILHE